MKKTILTSTLALGLGVTGFATGHSADAAENNVDQANLAQQAQNNPEQLNDSPVQDGSYNYDFAQNGTNYQFESDGENFNWSYNGYNDDSADESSNDSSTQQQTSSDEQPTQQAEQSTSSNEETTQTSSDESASSSSSDVNGHLQQIAQRESGGDTQAVNPSSGAAGKYQFLQSTWDSVAPSEYQGQSPTEAPEDVQDQAAQKLYDEVGADQWVTA
ncbi:MULTISPECIES: transglycosylase family protein [Staphylococcus]|uniref:transglycosylase family protein n=1 Tax=Staphylococcus TaxID=1279 RepID=UPI00189D95A8|nr:MULTISPECIES: transglycosylase family protein [Staphylococcus]MBF7018288.1 transglycosylase family protein [Staphylococcus durrellii]MDG0838848.1 transglycosylase family protein [Staphylococcus equorum]